MQLAKKIIIADDHPLFRTAMQQAVRQLVPDVVIEQAESLPELQRQVEQHKDADLVLLDLQMPVRTVTPGWYFCGPIFLKTRSLLFQPVKIRRLCVRRLIMKHRATLPNPRDWKALPTPSNRYYRGISIYRNKPDAINISLIRGRWIWPNAWLV